MSPPTLVVVSGPSGTGKTTFAHTLASEIGCPAICRDEIKEGMVHATPGFTPEVGDELTRRAYPVFFAVVGTLLEAGCTVVAEAAFQDKLWRPNLETLQAISTLRIVQCHTAPEVARRRIAQRGSRRAHADASLLQALEAGVPYFAGFDRVRTRAPSIDVDTTDGYLPALEEVLAFIAS